MINLPTIAEEAKNINAKKIFIFAHPKAGKTQAISGLPNNLVIDLEDGSGFVGGTIINVLAIAAERLELIRPKEVITHPEGFNTILQIIAEISEQLKQKQAVYDYITIDTATALVDIAGYLATVRYKQSSIGKNYTGKNVVKDLPNGAGYEWLREAYKAILLSLEVYAKECSIIVGHVRDASIVKQGLDITAKDIMLPGKLKSIICQECDAVGFLYRKDGNKTILSFETEERDLATGARPEHLANKSFVLVEENPKGSRQFTYNWNQIFI